jgi:hypothetical protein
MIIMMHKNIIIKTEEILNNLMIPHAAYQVKTKFRRLTKALLRVSGLIVLITFIVNDVITEAS